MNNEGISLSPHRALNTAENWAELNTIEKETRPKLLLLRVSCRIPRQSSGILNLILRNNMR